MIAVRRNILEQNDLKKNDQPESEFLKNLYKIVLKNIADEDFNIPRLCKALNMSRTQIHRKVTALTSHSTSKFIRMIKMQEAKKLLESTSFNISEVAYKVGYKNPTNFSSHFKAHFGFTPSETHN